MHREHWLNEIAKAAATEIPRREIMRRLFVGVAGAAAGALLGRRAWADPPPCSPPVSCGNTSECCPQQVCRNGRCENAVPCFVGGGMTPCGDDVCKPTETCCIGQPFPVPTCIDGCICPISDRNQKERFATVDTEDVLERLNGIEIQTWNYLFQDRAIRHIGPMAQDFRAAFGVGEDELHINLIDASGVALSGVQGLYRMLQQKDAELAAMRQQYARLAGRLEALEQASGCARA